MYPSPSREAPARATARTNPLGELAWLKAAAIGHLQLRMASIIAAELGGVAARQVIGKPDDEAPRSANHYITLRTVQRTLDRRACLWHRPSRFSNLLAGTEPG